MIGQSKRGFAAMGPQQQQEIARRGGQAAHKKGTAHEFTPEEARVAGRRGGKAISKDRQYMAMIGRKGGQNSGRRLEKMDQQTSSRNGDGQGGGGAPGAKVAGQKNAAEILRADHRRVEELFSQYGARDASSGHLSQQHEKVVLEISQELAAHAQIEEEIFYPAIRIALNEEDQNLVTDAIDEHQTIKNILAQIQGEPAGNGERAHLMQRLQECVAQHVQEEEKEILPKAETALGERLGPLGARLHQRKQELLGTFTESSRSNPPPTQEQSPRQMENELSFSHPATR